MFPALMWDYLFLSAIMLGLLLCAPPGAVNTEAFRRGVSGGFKRAWGIELGSCVGDLTWACLALIGLAFIVTNDVARILLGVGGAALLIYLAFQAVRDSRNKAALEGEIKEGRSDLVTGALISLGNPFQVAFWLGFGGSAIAVIVPDPTAVDYGIFIGGYVIGLMIWSFSYSVLIGYGRKYVTPKLFQAINIVCAAVMIYFAASLLWSTFTA
ncbi:MAG: leucine export protein LeuE [Methanomassiliicoccales archaeon PtaU1.Bin124]|nr:MAG: leucine export protein LeuE [Methanomassiliicoccales archaeon PtaU1.Bin124]